MSATQAHFTCPSCAQPFAVTGNGRFECPHCGQPVEINQQPSMELDTIDLPPPVIQEQRPGIFYEDSEIEVSRSQFNCGGKIYAIRNIVSVWTEVSDPSRVGELIFISFGALFLLIGFSGGWLSAIFGLILIAAGVAIWISKKPSYLIMFETAAGCTEGARFTDKLRAARVHSAINRAMADM